MRTRASLIGAGLLALAGCGNDGSAEPAAVPPPTTVNMPAASAGGACELLDFASAAKAVGVSFDVSGATEVNGTQSCVLRSQQAQAPDLTLSISKTKADVAIFKQEAVPRGGTSLSGLGRAAYRSVSAPAKGKAATAEVGWLSKDGRLVTVRYSGAPEDDQDSAEELVPGLVELAKKIDSRH
ncbi:hypothetical protein [Plantactinospora sp. KBS50]|uniref:hypothetical protein n=1 Tax=Plantactinospora sp. KBS50 TaxID=2024580 RepID=UPI000BAA9CB2|nr:hypothetical protein [Plantactinospora sp. KBS50]ASW54150.1 hypothetical protein CIK06_08015 [Plantactinospora sp. KBS50]